MILGQPPVTPHIRPHPVHFRFVSEQILVQVQGPGTRVYTFIVECGAGKNVVTPRVANELGLAHVGDASVVGGAGSADGAYTTVLQHLQVGGRALSGLPAIVASLAPIDPAVGERIDGLLGYNFLSRYVVELDYPNRIVALHDPGYRYRGPGARIKADIEGEHVRVPAALIGAGKSMPGRFTIDSGSSVGVMTASDYNQRFGLPEALGTRVLGGSGIGLGGKVPLKVARFQAIDLGGIRVAGPVVSMTQAQGGFFSTPGQDGTIGNPVLSRFRVFLDYGRKQVVLVPGPKTSQPIEYDCAGLSFACTPDLSHIIVTRVIADGPADQAGIKAGDLLTRIEGKPASQFVLSDVKRLFRIPGQLRRVEVLRGSSNLAFTIFTRSLV